MIFFQKINTNFSHQYIFKILNSPTPQQEDYTVQTCFSKVQSLDNIHYHFPKATLNRRGPQIFTASLISLNVPLFINTGIYDLLEFVPR